MKAVQCEQSTRKQVPHKLQVINNMIELHSRPKSCSGLRERHVKGSRAVLLQAALCCIKNKLLFLSDSRNLGQALLANAL